MVLRTEVQQQRSLEADLRLSALGLNTSTLAAVSSSSASLMSALTASVSGTLSLQSSFASFAALARMHTAHAARNLTHVRAILNLEQLVRFFDWVQKFGAVCVQINV